jgi:hypothetical protein
MLDAAMPLWRATPISQAIQACYRAMSFVLRPDGGAIGDIQSNLEVPEALVCQAPGGNRPQ